MKTQATALYLDTAIRERLFPTKRRLKFYTEALFRGVDLDNKAVLDIGGGEGLLTFYAAARGARRLVCLEPEADGSSAGVLEKIGRLKTVLGGQNVEFKPITLQAYAPEGEKFDVILLHQSINHLDEPACIGLLQEPRFKAVYRELFGKLFSLSNKGAKVIICDCSRYNLFALLGVRNPFVPTIEWHKHQAPQVWAELLAEVGFVNPRISWRSFNRLGNWGRVLLANKFAAYFLESSFCLRMEKP
jgi:SAM-dependent methyltransferase